MPWNRSSSDLARFFAGDGDCTTMIVLGQFGFFHPVQKKTAVFAHLAQVACVWCYWLRCRSVSYCDSLKRSISRSLWFRLSLGTYCSLRFFLLPSRTAYLRNCVPFGTDSLHVDRLSLALTILVPLRLTAKAILNRK